MFRPLHVSLIYPSFQSCESTQINFSYFPYKAKHLHPQSYVKCPTHMWHFSALFPAVFVFLWAAVFLYAVFPTKSPTRLSQDILLQTCPLARCHQLWLLVRMPKLPARPILAPDNQAWIPKSALKSWKADLQIALSLSIQPRCCSSTQFILTSHIRTFRPEPSLPSPLII